MRERNRKQCDNKSFQIDGGPSFCIQRGVPQGAIISPALFHAGLEHAMQKWKQRLSSEGVEVGMEQRLTNIRYADDLLIYGNQGPNWYS